MWQATVLDISLDHQKLSWRIHIIISFVVRSTAQHGMSVRFSFQSVDRQMIELNTHSTLTTWIIAVGYLQVG
jgi:hypothetical protein